MKIAVGDRVRLLRLNLTGTVVAVSHGLFYVRLDGERWRDAASIPVEQHELERID